MNYKFLFKENIKKHLLGYIFICLITSIAIGVSLNAKNALKRNQIVSMFIASNGVKNQVELRKKMLDFTNVNSIRQATTNYANPKGESFNTQYTTIGLKSSDIVIIPESVIEDASLSYIYAEIPSTNKYYSSTNYSYNEKHYGICVHNDLISYLDNYIEYGEEEYFMFFPITSPHLLEFVSDSTTNSVYLLLEGLLK